MERGKQRQRAINAFRDILLRKRIIATEAAYQLASSKRPRGSKHECPNVIALVHLQRKEEEVNEARHGNWTNGVKERSYGEEP